jgi:hypothetical protein
MTPRTIYVDPGTAWTAWVICEPARPGEPLPLRVVAHDKIPTGSLVDLPADKVTTRTRADGSEVTKDKRREVSPADRRRVANLLAGIAAEYCVRRAVVERIGYVFLGGSEGRKRAQAESAKETAKVEELICDRLETAGVTVVPVKRQTWANRLRILLPKKVVGAPSMGRAELLPVLQTGFADAWPSAAGEHERDCGGMALWDALPPLASKRAARAATSAARGPRAKRERRTTPRGDRVRSKMGPIDLAKYRATDSAWRKRLWAKRREEGVAARAAAGCECRKPDATGKVRLGGRHKRECPLSQAKPKAVPYAERMAAELAAWMRYLDG